MRLLVRLSVLVLLLAVGGVVALPGAPLCAEKKETSKEAPNKFDALKRFSQVLDLVERYYERDVTQGDLINGAVKGMLQGLDPHSNFMTADD